MKPIYEPQGRAREYSPYALNIYKGCIHRCVYCYAAKYPYPKTYFEIVEPRPNIIPLLEKQLERERFDKQILLSFIGDPYNPEEAIHNVTRQAISALRKHGVPVAILTKGGTRCLKDMDVFKRFGGHIKVGASLTFIEEKDSLEFEPGAPLPGDRFEALRELHRNDVATWASLEPVIYPDQALRIIEASYGFVDHYKVGKVNHWPEHEKGVDWTGFVEKAVLLLRSLRKPFYIKQSLRVFSGSIHLMQEETDQDHLNVL